MWSEIDQELSMQKLKQLSRMCKSTFILTLAAAAKDVKIVATVKNAAALKEIETRSELAFLAGLPDGAAFKSATVSAIEAAADPNKLPIDQLWRIERAWEEYEQIFDLYERKRRTAAA